MRVKDTVRVHVLVLEASVAFVSVGVFDLLRKASELASMTDSSRRIRPQLVAAGSSHTVTTAGGLPLTCPVTLAEAGPCDIAVVPALDPDVLANVEKNRAILPWLARLHARGGEVASACTGAFVLAAAGLLDGRRATTHWAFQSLLAERYPHIRVAPQAVLVDERRIITAGGATSFIQLALFLVERALGPEVSHAASRMFLIDPNKSPQSAYAIFTPQKQHEDGPILRAQEIIERDGGRSASVRDLARQVALSERTFLRRFITATGESPLGYVQRVRVEAAKRALERGESVASVANLVGYEDIVAFRRVFARTTGLRPMEYRARYGPRSAPAFDAAE